MALTRRSARNIYKPPLEYDFTPSYPDGVPQNEFERRVAALDNQSFPSEIFAAVDDVLVYALFGSKRRPNGYRALHPTRAFGQVEPLITREQAIRIRHVYQQHAGKQGEGQTKDILKAADAIFQEHPAIFNREHVPVLEQYVHCKVLHTLPTSYHFFSLLHRYDILYSQDSPVVLAKVSFDSQTIAVGLKARKRIPAACPILSTSTSMSSDLISPGVHAVSIIESGPGQKGPQGSRLMLGPLRFANHDCAPNCQVSDIPNRGFIICIHFSDFKFNLQFNSIKGSHAFMLWSIMEIGEDEAITVKYTKDAYFEDGCACKTCHPDNPPDAPRHTIEKETSTSMAVVAGKKRTRRGGRSKPGKKKKEEHNEDV